MNLDGTDACPALLARKRKLARDLAKKNKPKNERAAFANQLVDGHRYLELKVSGRIEGGFYREGITTAKIRQLAVVDFFCECCVASFEWNVTQDTPRTLIAEVTGVRDHHGVLSAETVHGGAAKP